MIDLSKIDYKTRKVTYISYEELKEDMLQVNFPNSLILDLGWYDPEFVYISSKTMTGKILLQFTPFMMKNICLMH